MYLSDRDSEFSTIIDFLSRGIESAHRDDWESAENYLDQAEKNFHRVADQSEKSFGIAAAISEGRGQLGLRRGQVEKAITYLERALKERSQQEEHGGKPQLLPRAVSYMNLAGAYQHQKDEAKALAYNAQARDLLKGQKDPNLAFFYVTALQTAGQLHEKTADLEKAMAFYQEALHAYDTLKAEKSPELILVNSQLLLKMAALHYQSQSYLESKDFAEAASELAIAVFEQHPEKAQLLLGSFVKAQMTLMDLAFQDKAFSKAEDALFKVLRLVGPNPQIYAKGLAFYEELLKLDDGLLMAGDLPRDEVEEGQSALLQMAAEVQKNGAPN